MLRVSSVSLGHLKNVNGSYGLSVHFFFFFCWNREKPFWQLDSFGSLTGIRNFRCPQKEKKKIQGALQICHYQQTRDQGHTGGSSTSPPASQCPCACGHRSERHHQANLPNFLLAFPTPKGFCRNGFVYQLVKTIAQRHIDHPSCNVQGL